MTPTEQRAWDAKIGALKHAGVPMPERVELAKHQLAEEAAARAEPEPPDPVPPVVPDDDSVAEHTAESDGPDATVDETNAELRAEGKAQQGRNEPKRRKRVDRKDAKTMTALPVSTGTDARRDEQLPTTNGALLKAREAAKVLGVCERTLWTLDRQGEIPRVSVGRSVRYDPSDLRDWIEKQKR